MPEFATYPSLKDRSVVVTGGASGIGAEIVRAFAVQQERVQGRGSENSDYVANADYP